MPATSSVVGSCAEPASLPWLLWVHFARKCRCIFVWCSREGSFAELFGLRSGFFEMQEVKLCFSFCRIRIKRCDIGTPGEESQGGGSSGEAVGRRVHVKVILFLRWTATVEAVRWLATAGAVFLARKVHTWK